MKVSEFPLSLNTSGNDLLYIVDGSVSKKITIDGFFNSVPSNTSFSGTLSVGSDLSVASNTSSQNLTVSDMLTVQKIKIENSVQMSNTFTPANSTISVDKGTIFFDSNYLYVAVANNNLKRIALETF